MSKVSTPKLSVILPVYNGLPYLIKSIESVLNQNFSEFEFIICDDTSTDESFSKIIEFDDSRLKIIKNSTNLGLFKTLNKLVDHTSTNCIKLWAQDDIMYPNCLESFYKFYLKHPDLGFIYSQRDIIDENSQIIEKNSEDGTPSIIDRQLHDKISLQYGCIAGNIANVLLYKNKFYEVEGFDNTMIYSGDFDLFVRLTQHYKAGFINSNLVQLRRHNKQLSRDNKKVIFNLIENKKILTNIINRLDPIDKQELSNKAFKFYGNLYISVFLLLLRNGEWLNAYRYGKELSYFGSIPTLLTKWLLNKKNHILSHGF